MINLDVLQNEMLRCHLNFRQSRAWVFDIRPQIKVYRVIINDLVTVGRKSLGSFLQKNYGHCEIWATYERVDGMSYKDGAMKYRPVQLQYRPGRPMFQAILDEMMEGEMICQLVEVRDGLAACGYIVYQPIQFRPQYFSSLCRSFIRAQQK